MTSENETPEDPPKKQGKALIFISIPLSLVIGAGLFWGITQYMPQSGESHTTDQQVVSSYAIDDLEFVTVDPIVVSMNRGDTKHHLRFKAELEVPAKHQRDVEKLMPRVVDVFNAFLRALDWDDMEHPTALHRMRAQMLRRAKIVLGDTKVNDLLVTEFVLN